MSLNKLSLLYVEDEYEIASLMRELLEDEVSTLYVAKNGEEGLQMYEEHKPDIVLSDIYMPKLDGLSMSKSIKELYPEQPIILLTAFNNIDDLKQAIMIGIDSYVNKPIRSIEELNKPLKSVAKKLGEKKELKILSERVQQQSRLAATGEVMSFIAHQWKQPLSAISAKISMLQLKNQLGTLEEDDLFVLMDFTMNKIKYLTQTINDFRDYLKPKEDPKEFTLESVFSQTKSLLGDKIYSEKVHLMITPNEINLVGYKNKLIHVITNIINNACDALVEHESEKKYIFVDVQADEQFCTIYIQDSAGGIQEELLSEIFEPYYTTKAEEHGTGLGLYMAREFIVGQMGGDLSVQNASYEHEGKTCTGARFDIRIPKIIKKS
jgi:signal transduction histidine kinase